MCCYVTMETIVISLRHAPLRENDQPVLDMEDPRNDPKEYARFRAQQEITRKMLMRKYRTRNAVMGLGLTAGIIAVYAYSMYAVKQETFLDKEFDQPAPSSNS